MRLGCGVVWWLIFIFGWRLICAGCISVFFRSSFALALPYRAKKFCRGYQFYVLGGSLWFFLKKIFVYCFFCIFAVGFFLKNINCLIIKGIMKILLLYLFVLQLALPASAQIGYRVFASGVSHIPSCLGYNVIARNYNGSSVVVHHVEDADRSSHHFAWVS